LYFKAVQGIKTIVDSLGFSYVSSFVSTFVKTMVDKKTSEDKKDYGETKSACASAMADEVGDLLFFIAI